MSAARTTKKTQLANAANPALEQLGVLVGEWQVELSLPTDPTALAAGHGSFKWLEDGAYLAYHIGDKSAGAPYSICVIGRDESVPTYTMLYFDDRGVSRICQMSLEGREWKQWRDAPGFSQRFVGHISEDGNTITARWEKSKDGSHSENDFNMTYRRIVQRNKAKRDGR